MNKYLLSTYILIMVLVGCSKENEVLTVIVNSQLYFEVSQINGGIQGKFNNKGLPKGNNNFEKSDNVLTKMLIERQCNVFIPIEFNQETSRYMSSQVNLSCPGMSDAKVIPAYLIGSDKMTGIKNIELGGIYKLVITETFEI